MPCAPVRACQAVTRFHSTRAARIADATGGPAQILRCQANEDVTGEASDGTATSPADFATTATTLTFAVGAASMVVQVPIVDDVLDEPDETVLLTLTNPTAGAALGARTTATLSIVDNDLPSTVTPTATVTPTPTPARPGARSRYSERRNASRSWRSVRGRSNRRSRDAFASPWCSSMTVRRSVAWASWRNQTR